MKIKIPDYIIEGIARRWDDMPAGERRDEATQAAATYGVAPSTVYRRVKALREYGHRATDVRADRGKPRIGDEDVLKKWVGMVMGLKALDPTKPNKHIANPHKAMSTERAIEILEKKGDIPEGVLNPRSVNRWAKVWDITVAAICSPTPAVKLVSLHPNHVHLVDFSVCNQYYLRESDGKVVTPSWVYKNRPNESKQKIWCFSLVDHFTDVKFMMYFMSAGESAEILFTGLKEAWKKKDDPQVPFHGAPAIVYSDRGSALKARMIANLLDALHVKPLDHFPGNARAKGKVETSFRTLQRNFETELRLCPARTINDMNMRLYNWMIDHNWRVQEGKDAARNSIWQMITPEQLLELPDDYILRSVAATGEIRTVNAYSAIRLDNVEYGVPAELMGKRVRVWRNIDGGLSVQDLETGTMHPTIDTKTAVFGEYNAHPKSDVQRAREEALAMAGEIRKEITPDMLLRDVPNTLAMPRTGTRIEVTSDLVPVVSAEYDNIYQAKAAIADELRISLSDLPDWMLEEIDGALRETLNKLKVHEMARFIAGVLDEARQAV